MKDGALMIEAGIGVSLRRNQDRSYTRRRALPLAVEIMRPSGSQARSSIRQFTTQRSIPNRTNIYDDISSARHKCYCNRKSSLTPFRNSEKISIWMKYPAAFALDTKKVELEEMIASEK